MAASGLFHRPRCSWSSSTCCSTRFNSSSTRNINHAWLHFRNRPSSCLAAASSVSRPAGTETKDATQTDAGVPTTLLIGSQQDAASCAMISALLARGDWLPTPPGQEPGTVDNRGRDEEGGKAWTHAKAPHVSMWAVKGRLLDLDDADRRWTELQEFTEGAVGKGQRRRRRAPTDVVFLSRHVAKSGVPALCVHPIGVPDVSGLELSRCHDCTWTSCRIGPSYSLESASTANLATSFMCRP